MDFLVGFLSRKSCVQVVFFLQVWKRDSCPSNILGIWTNISHQRKTKASDSTTSAVRDVSLSPQNGCLCMFLYMYYK